MHRAAGPSSGHVHQHVSHATRCPRADDRCRAERPPLAGDARLVACFHPEVAMEVTA
jgi:peptide/nickel transport system ATP-binding protein